MSERQILTNKPGFGSVLVTSIGPLIIVILFCFIASYYAADPVATYLHRKNHKEMMWYLFSASGGIALLMTLSKLSKPKLYTTLEFDTTGFIFTRGKDTKRVVWIDIVDWHYSEKLSPGFFGPQRSGYLQIYLRNGDGVECLGFDQKSVDTMVQQLNQSAKHLPFVWRQRAPKDPDRRDTVSGILTKIENPGDSLQHRTARINVRVESALYGKQSDFPNPLIVTWEFWWVNAAGLPQVGTTVSLFGYLSPSAGLFFAGGMGYTKHYEKLLRTDAS